MKRFPITLAILVTCLLAACGGGGEKAASETAGGYLDSAYVSKTYRAAMDSIKNSSGIAEADFKQLQGFMRDYRDSIPGHPTYRSLLESAKGIDEMKAGIALSVENVSLHHDQKLVELRLVLAFQNKLDMAINKFRGDLAWLDDKGGLVSRTPAFSVVGPIPGGGSLSKLRLEYTLYKPTGNELNDPRNQAKRDTLERIEEVMKRKDLSAFKFRLMDMRLANGLRPSQYWLMPLLDRQKLPEVQIAPPSKWTGLMDWAKKNETLIEQLKPSNSPYSIMLSPVLTDKVEASHGPYLILDRVEKVRAFLTGQKGVSNANVNEATAGKRLVSEELIDFWNWPMELRVYELIEPL
jgi:hypothetical protein